MRKYLLQFSHNVIEHLGLKLYQNRPTSVIAEIVSNCWDADAERVEIDIAMGSGDRWISVLDTGRGMTPDQLADEYLVIGYARRRLPTETTENDRPLMGRKGIGKLAPFGIATVVDVVTCAVGKLSGKPDVTWLQLELSKLIGPDAARAGKYEPKSVYEGPPESLPKEKDVTGQVAKWQSVLAKSGSDSGTLVLMRELSLKKALNENQVIGSLGRRFTVALRDDFRIFVNARRVELSNGLPHFEFRIPNAGTLTELVHKREVRHWVGFVHSADWPQDQAGVGVYAHGKLAQDRPFTFGSRGKEIFTRYMYAVVEADWLDELPIDLISTDRTSINWQSDETKDLYEWGRKKVGSWVSEFARWREAQEREENRRRVVDIQAAGKAPKVTDSERDQIVELVSRITPEIGKDESAKAELIQVVSEAWVQKPMRKLVKDLWEALGSTGDSAAPKHFVDVVGRLAAYSVPESLGLAVIFGQRAFALTKLHDYVHNGIELDLQRLIERFPWIIEPDLAVLTANQALKTAVLSSEEHGQIPKGRRAEVAGISEKNKPDFVFLSSPEEKQIVIVELKNPQVDLTIENRVQLQDYMTYFEVHYPDADIVGVLVGRNPSNMEPKYAGLRIVPWTKVLQKSRARNVELLAAMLAKTSGDVKGDSRIEAAVQLGGPSAKDMLARLAEHHESIQDLLDEFESELATSPESDSGIH